jgi:hypothetical protein
MWKALNCTAQGTYEVLVNCEPHARGAMPCKVKIPPKLTPIIVAFLTEQDELGFPV